MSRESNLDQLTNWLQARYHDQTEYLQATSEIARDVIDVFNANEAYKQYDVLRRLSVPERIIHFTVHWLNDDNQVEIHQGWRVQHSGLIGPYKGGLRFHPTVNESILKFLAFEQSFKNALTGLPIGGAKGGSDFNPRGRSETEIMRFCQAFMTELYRHIGPNTDVPAGDINVSGREIGFLYGQYRRILNQFGGTLTGKDISFGGSHVRTEATGFGLIYMLEAVLETHQTPLKNKVVGISGAGNVALHAALRATQLGARVVSLSNSRGALLNESGFSENSLTQAIETKDQHNNILKALSDDGHGDYQADASPWQLNMDIALPCATQNEIDEPAAQKLVDHNVRFLLEGANMPCTTRAHQVLAENKIVYVPGKASNAGGVAISGLEMSQNAAFRRDSYSDIDTTLKHIMRSIHQQCLQEGQRDGEINYAKGANIAGFRRLADAIVMQGL
ncbi:NADP-specific glutamate dehydrogenase [Salinimonas lutimaris]|uniref:NADP-specific glutamate dehydrogenase n=1 Tax=Salinimonas lutimaris TaxID=914153 RepID=UPI0010C01666|nr:NADP-specific glutamate dehydrogenase [Salinimonas lutimaris]